MLCYVTLWPPEIIFIKQNSPSITWSVKFCSSKNDVWTVFCQNFPFSFSWYSEYLSIVILWREWRILLKYHCYYRLNYWNTIGAELDKRENKKGVWVLRCAATLKSLIMIHSQYQLTRSLHPPFILVIALFGGLIIMH